MVLIRRFREKTGIIWSQGKMGLNFEVAVIEGGENIGGSVLIVELTSPPNIDTGGIEVRPMSGVDLLEAKKEGRRRKEGVCQEYIGVRGY